MDAYVGSINIFAGNYAPVGWAICNGQSLAVQSYQALFALLSYTYGGSGANFNLPDLRGRAPVGTGIATANTPAYTAGQKAGTDVITLTSANLPAHDHNGTMDLMLGCDTTDTGAVPTAAGNYPTLYMGAYSLQADANMPPPDITDITVDNAGGGESFNQRGPYLPLNYIICIQGYFPNRS